MIIETVLSYGSTAGLCAAWLTLYLFKKKEKKKVTGQRKCPCDSTERTGEISQEGDDFE